MGAFTECFIVFVMVVVIVMYVRSYYGEIEIVKAKADGRRYIVRKLPDRQEAAEMLAAINVDLQRTIAHMRKRYPRDPDVRRLEKNYNPESLSEGGMEVGYTSYSVNKGEKIVLCLRQKSGQLVERNVMLYVALHELGHLMTEEVGHTTDFWSNFKRIAKAAVEIGVYSRVDFDAKPKPYCGITIASSVI